MPVQPVISLEQIVIIVAFLMMLFVLMWFVRRHRGDHQPLSRRSPYAAY